MTCTHIKETKEWIEAAVSWITGESEEPTVEGTAVRWFIPLANTYDLATLRNAAEDYKEWMRKAREKLANAEEELDNCNCVQQGKTALQKEWDDYHEKEVNKLRKKIQSELDNGEKLNNKVTSLSKEISSLKQTSQREKDSLNQRIRDLESAKSSSERDLQWKIEDLNRQINSLSTKSKENKQEIYSLEEKLRKKEQEKTALQSNYNSLSSSHSTLNNNYDSLKDSHNILKKNYDSLKKVEADLRGKLKKSENDYKELKKVESNLKKEIEKKEQEKIVLQNDYNNLTEVKTNLEQKLEKSERDREKLQKDLSQFQRSIILVGNTGSGKSTLANVLVNKEGAFKESGGSVSETKEVQVEEFVAENGIKYRVIDIIGFNDTKITSEEVVKKVRESTFEGDYNLNQILLVFNGRFENKDKEIFEILSDKVFDKNIAKCTTIVRTHFDNFSNETDCEKDREKLRNESEEYKQIINAVNKIVYVDNPSLKGPEFMLEGKRKVREMSRKVILDHLLMNCSENYQTQEKLVQIEQPPK